MSEFATLRARLHCVRLLTAAVRLQLAIKANFNPAQLRVPAVSRGAAGGQVMAKAFNSLQTGREVIRLTYSKRNCL